MSVVWNRMRLPRSVGKIVWEFFSRLSVRGILFNKNKRLTSFQKVWENSVGIFFRLLVMMVQDKRVCGNVA